MGKEAAKGAAAGAVARRGRSRASLGGNSPEDGPSLSPRGGSPMSPSPPPVGHSRATMLAEQPLHDRLRSLKTRTRSTLAMVAGFTAILYAGHVVVCIFIMCIQTCFQAAMVSELFTLAAQKNIEKGLPGFRLQQWYFFACGVFFVYGRLLKANLLVEVSENAQWLPGIFSWSVRHHVFVSYGLYTLGFVLFVVSLNKKSYFYQFAQFAWTHMIILVILMQSSFFVANIMEGLIWFVLPSSLVIINDIMAYCFGFFFGRTPLIKLSPKKTWEGFLGALVSTLVVGFYFSRYLGQFQWLVCPRKDMTIRTWLTCEPANTFRALPAAETLAPLPAFIRDAVLALLPPDYTLLPLQLHALSFALFAAVIAPFGGFFASGFKRALRVKDFGDSIPGHGGLTDRMDCQIIMAVFSYIYIDAIVGLGDVTVSGLIEKAQRLPHAEQVELYRLLAQMVGKPFH